MTCTLIEPEAGLLVLLRQDFERDDGFNLAVEILQWAPADVPAGPAHPAAGRGDLLVVPLGSSFLRMLNQSGQETKAREVEQVIGQQLCSRAIRPSTWLASRSTGRRICR